MRHRPLNFSHPGSVARLFKPFSLRLRCNRKSKPCMTSNSALRASEPDATQSVNSASIWSRTPANTNASRLPTRICLIWDCSAAANASSRSTSRLAWSVVATPSSSKTRRINRPEAPAAPDGLPASESAYCNPHAHPLSARHFFMNGQFTEGHLAKGYLRHPRRLQTRYCQRANDLGMI